MDMVETSESSNDSRISVNNISDSFITIDMELRDINDNTSMFTVHLNYSDVYALLQISINEMRHECINIGARDCNCVDGQLYLSAMGGDVRNQHNKKIFGVIITAKNTQRTEAYINSVYPSEIAAVGRGVING